MWNCKLEERTNMDVLLGSHPPGGVDGKRKQRKMKDSRSGKIFPKSLEKRDKKSAQYKKPGTIPYHGNQREARV